MGLSFQINRTPVRNLDGEVAAERFKVTILNRYAKAVKGINMVLRDGAKEIQLLAQEYAPYAPPELGGSEDPRRHLQDAIEVKEEGDPQAKTFGGKGLKVTVWVNGRRQGRITAAGRVISIGTYAWLMHEGLSPYGSGAYHARAGTISKNPYAGGKFLERAYKDQKQMIIKNAAKALKDGMK